MTISKSFATTTALSLESVAKTFIVLQCKTTFFTGMEDFQQFLLQLRALKIKIEGKGTLESGIDVGQGINVGPGKLGKKNKRRALNTHVLCSE